MWHQYACYICLGHKQIEIGNNLTNKRVKVILCPCCQGKGYLHVKEADWNPSSDKFWKRMTRQDKDINDHE